MRRWEYQRITNWKPSERELNNVGDEGWELVGFTHFGEYIFKRPIIAAESKD